MGGHVASVSRNTVLFDFSHGLGGFASPKICQTHKVPLNMMSPYGSNVKGYSFTSTNLGTFFFQEILVYKHRKILHSSKEKISVV